MSNNKKQEVTYDMVCAFGSEFDSQCSDAYIMDILNGDIDVEKLKSFIIKNYVENKDATENDEIKGSFPNVDSCMSIYTNPTDPTYE